MAEIPHVCFQLFWERLYITAEHREKQHTPEPLHSKVQNSLKPLGMGKNRSQALFPLPLFEIKIESYCIRKDLLQKLELSSFVSIKWFNIGKFFIFVSTRQVSGRITFLFINKYQHYLNGFNFLVPKLAEEREFLFRLNMANFQATEKLLRKLWAPGQRNWDGSGSTMHHSLLQRHYVTEITRIHHCAAKTCNHLGSYLIIGDIDILSFSIKCGICQLFLNCCCSQWMAL